MLGVLVEVREQLSTVCSLLALWAPSGDGTQIIRSVQQMSLPAEPFLWPPHSAPIFDFLDNEYLRTCVNNSTKTMWVIPRTTYKSKSSKYTLKNKYEFVSE